ncbi:MAG: glycosyltransferase family 4 protein [Myxococcota bacterium]
MLPRKLRLAVIASHPIQYQSPLFRTLAEQVELRVFYCWNPSATDATDPEFGRSVTWDIPLLEGFDYEFVRNVTLKPGSASYGGLFNPEMPGRIVSWRPDAVLIQGYSHATFQLAALALKSARIPLIFRGESNLLNRRQWTTRVIKNLTVRPFLALFDACCAIGSANRDYLVHYGVDPRRIFHSPYSVDNLFFQMASRNASTQRDTTRASLGIGPAETVFLFVGKLIPKKGCADLIEAFTRRPMSDTQLIIVGDGPERRELEASVQGRAREIHFVGFKNQSELPTWYAAADVFVIPSLFEPWGLVVNEAMNYGLPLICSNEVSSAFDLVDASNGWRFPAGDVGRLSNALSEAASTNGLSQMGIRSRERIENWGISETAAGIREAAEFSVRAAT